MLSRQFEGKRLISGACHCRYCITGRNSNHFKLVDHVLKKTVSEIEPLWSGLVDNGMEVVAASEGGIAISTGFSDNNAPSSLRLGRRAI